MSALPTIPEDAARAAGWRVVGLTGMDNVPEPGVIAAALVGAWPHLYAAALRHAAEELDKDFIENINTEAFSEAHERQLNTLRRLSWRHVRHLRRLADQAVQA